MTLLIPLLAFVFISLLVTAGAMALSPGAAAAIERRLGELRTIPSKPAGEKIGAVRFAGAMKRLGEYAPKSSTADVGRIRARLIASGYRGGEAVAVFTGIRLGCAVLGFAVMANPLFGRPNIMLALAATAMGYVLPSMVLARMAKRRQHRIRLSLPDALDLLVVSVEAGLGLDQAVQRVADELDFAHPELCDELRLVNLELRAGKARAEALHNLGTRTGVDDLMSLVAMLVQTDKFGTSVAQSLRVHSETLRTKRRQRAEEAAAKTGVKMVFPLVFCIFPAIWVVTLGPAVIKFIEVVGPMSDR